jgi:NCS1 family nucleobase:cation symporter-1
VFLVASVWVPRLQSLSDFAWLLGALFGGVLHYGLMRNQLVIASAPQPAPLG